MVQPKQMDIFYRDLNPDAQQEVLKFYGIGSPDEANWADFPIVTLEHYPEDTDDTPSSLGCPD